MKPNFRRPLWPSLRSASWPILMTLLCSTGLVQAEVFKWIGPDGKVNYGDRPATPPLRAEKKAVTANVVDGSDLPFGLAEVKKNTPVTFYSGQKCNACDEGRKLLSQRGIPFTEKTVVSNADIASFGGNEVELPQLMVGTARLNGFDAAAWQARLSAAGYPQSNQLPKSYRNPTPVSAAPAAPPKAAPDNEPAVGDAGGAARKPADTPPARPAPARASDSTLPGLRF